MSPSASRKGSRRTIDIPPDIREALNRGELQSATLTEGLAVDQACLLRTVFANLPLAAYQEATAACQLGIVRRMKTISGLILTQLGQHGLESCLSHRSDTVRGWACFMLGAQQELALAQRLVLLKPLADDAHFGVREWAWIAIRPLLAAELSQAIELLTRWAVQPSERLRRFACEALRPRGVWCAHLSILKEQPTLMLPILTELRADPSVYVQDSVANWLNDAAKDHPDWVRALCHQWQQASPIPATQRICKRAMRHLPP